MMKAKKIQILIGIILLLTSCHKSEKFNFYGKWQSLNDKNFIVEITSDDKYNFYKDGKLFFDKQSGLQNLEIKIEHKNDNWFNFSVQEKLKEERFFAGRIETVNEDRIRIYFHKHHQILDLADEFHRTNDLSGFTEIMDDIYKSPEKN